MKKTVIVYAIVFVLTLSSCAKTESQKASESVAAVTTQEPSTPVVSMYVSPSKVTAQPPEVKNLQDMVLVNERDDNENGLFYLGMTVDDLMSVLLNNKIDFCNLENDLGPSSSPYDNSCLYYFLIFSNTISVHVNHDVVDYIELRGSAPIKATSTQAGLNLGDSVDKMVELYGDDYTVKISSVPDEETYKVYEYKMGSYDFSVYFLNDVAARWGISTSAETFYLVNELDDEEGLIFLGVSYDKLIKILDENDLGHGKMEDSDGGVDYVIEFGWNDGYFMVMFDEENDVVNGIEISGPEPVLATATQKGLNIGDSLDKMVELYGDDYTKDTIQFTAGETYTLYDYQLGDHYFEVCFQSDKITSWRIGN